MSVNPINPSASMPPVPSARPPESNENNEPDKLASDAETTSQEQAPEQMQTPPNVTDTNTEVANPNEPETQAEPPAPTTTTDESTAPAPEAEALDTPLPQGTFPEDFEGAIRFSAFRNVFKAANANDNKVVSRGELNRVDRTQLNKRQNAALDLLISNYDDFAGPGKIRLDDLKAVASIDRDQYGISEADLQGSGDQLRGKALRRQAREEYNIVLDGDIKDESIIRVMYNLDAIPEEHRNAYQESGLSVHLHQRFDLFAYGYASNDGAHLSQQRDDVPEEFGLTDSFGRPIERRRRIDAGGVVQHEVAHGLDRLVPEDAEYALHSQSPEFTALINRPAYKKRFERFLDDPIELFARLYASYAAEPGTEPEYDRSSLPKAVRRYFRDIQFTPLQQ